LITRSDLTVKKQFDNLQTAADCVHKRVVRSPQFLASEPHFQEQPISLESGARTRRGDQMTSLTEGGEERVAMALRMNEHQQQQQLEIDQASSLELRSCICLHLRSTMVNSAEKEVVNVRLYTRDFSSIL